jgi:hypothetical protein
VCWSTGKGALYINASGRAKGEVNDEVQSILLRTESYNRHESRMWFFEYNHLSRSHFKLLALDRGLPTLWFAWTG